MNGRSVDKLLDYSHSQKNWSIWDETIMVTGSHLFPLSRGQRVKPFLVGDKIVDVRQGKPLGERRSSIKTIKTTQNNKCTNLFKFQSASSWNFHLSRVWLSSLLGPWPRHLRGQDGYQQKYPPTKIFV